MNRAVDTAAAIEAFARGCADAIGAKYVITAADELEPFETDFWRQNRGKAALALRPGTTQEVAAVVRLAREHGVQILVQGGNTGLANGSIPNGSGDQAVLLLSRLNRIRKVGPGGDYLVVEAGCILADVQQAATDAGRYFPLSLGAEGSCQIGGNLATNAGGINVLRYGNAREQVLGLEVVLPDGNVWDGLQTLRKDNTGYDLKQLFIGSEGTLGIITAAVVRLAAQPRERVTAWLSVHSTEDAIALFSRMRGRFGDLISSFELVPEKGVALAVEKLPGVRRPVEGDPDWHVLMEVAWTFADGLQARVEEALAELFEEGLCLDGAIAESEQQRLNMWRVREGQAEAAREAGLVVRSDISVPLEEIPPLLRDVDQFAADFGDVVRFLPFGHVGDGNLHVNFAVAENEAERLEKPLLEHVYASVIARGGSVSAEHGVGRAKRDVIRRSKSPVAIEMMARIRQALDPDRVINADIGLV